MQVLSCYPVTSDNNTFSSLSSRKVNTPHFKFILNIIDYFLSKTAYILVSVSPYGATTATAATKADTAAKPV